METAAIVEALARAAFLIGDKGEPLPRRGVRDAPGAGRRVRAICCRRCRRSSGARSAASRRSSRTTSRTSRSRRCLSCSPMTPTARASSRCSKGSRPTGESRRAKPSAEQIAMLERIRRGCSRAAAGAARRMPSRAHAAPTPEAVRARRASKAASGANGKRIAMAKHEKYQRLIDCCKTLPPTPTAVVHPCDQSSMRGRGAGGEARPDRADPGGPARARSRRPRRPPTSTSRRSPMVDAPHSHAAAARRRAAGARRQGRGADERQPAHRRADGRGGQARDAGCAPRAASATASSWTCRATRMR